MDNLRQKQLTLWLKAQSHPHRRALHLATLFGAMHGVLIVAQAALLATLLHRFIIEQVSPDSQLSLFVTLAVVVALKAAAIYQRERWCFTFGARLRAYLRQKVLKQLDTAQVQQQSSGAWVALVQEQIENLHDFFARYLPQVMLVAIIPTTIIVAVIPINWVSALIFLVTLPLVPLFMVLIGGRAAEANQRNVKALSLLSGHFLDRLKGLHTLQLFARTQAETTSIRSTSEAFRHHTLEVLRIAFLSSAALEFFTALAVAVVAIYFGFSYLGEIQFGGSLLAPDEGVTLFAGLFVLFLAPEFYLPMRELGAYYHAKAKAIAAAEKLDALLNQGLTNVAPIDSITIDSSRGITIELIECEVLTLDGQILVGPLSLTIPAQSHCALIGRSGSGKSSLLAALLGFLPYRGSILINGVELRRINLSHWRQEIGWLSQQPHLLTGTVRENLQIADPTASDETLIAALTRSHAWDFLVPQGLDYRVEDGLAGLSVGQAQRIALTRTLLKTSSFFTLDEPTASLDGDSEFLIWQTINQAVRGDTLLLITHRLEQLQAMDEILLLDKGNIIDRGDYQSLIQRHPQLLDVLHEDQGAMIDA